MPKAEMKSDWFGQFVKILNGLTDENHQISEEIEEFIRKLKESDIKILRSTDDRETVVWFWCKSERALEELKKLKESHVLQDVFCRLLKQNPATVKSQDVNLDSDQYNRNVGKFKLKVSPYDIKFISLFNDPKA